MSEKETVYVIMRQNTKAFYCQIPERAQNLATIRRQLLKYFTGFKGFVHDKVEFETNLNIVYHIIPKEFHPDAEKGVILEYFRLILLQNRGFIMSRFQNLSFQEQQTVFEHILKLEKVEMFKKLPLDKWGVKGICPRFEHIQDMNNEMFDIWIEQGGDPDGPQGNWVGKAALAYDISLMFRLLDAGGNPDGYADKLKVKYPPISVCSFIDLQKIFEYGANPNIEFNWDDVIHTPLSYCLSRYRPEKSISILLDNGADPNYWFSNGEHITSRMSDECDFEVLWTLCSYGCTFDQVPNIFKGPSNEQIEELFYMGLTRIPPETVYDMIESRQNVQWLYDLKMDVSVPEAGWVSPFNNAKGLRDQLDYTRSGIGRSLFEICRRRIIRLRQQGRVSEMQVDGYPVKIVDGNFRVYDDSTGEEGPAIPFECYDALVQYSLGFDNSLIMAST